jgi:hypothetical protein
MASFIPGVDTAVVAADPVLDVLASATRPLPAGRHVFQLVVVDNAGNQSSVDSVSVTVRDRSRPTARIDFVRPDGTRVYDNGIDVAYGQPFRLTGERSADANGKIAQWRWTLVSE